VTLLVTVAAFLITSRLMAGFGREDAP